MTKKKLAKPVSWQNAKLNRPKSQEEKPIQPKTGKTTKDWLTPGYGKKPSISPWEGHQKKQPNQDTIILTTILLLYPRTLVNPQIHV